MKIKDVTKNQDGSYSGKISLADLAKLPHGCAWKDCPGTWHGVMPSDWVNILAWAGQPDSKRTIADVAFDPLCYRDACLCPEHASEFFGKLKPIGRKGTG